MFSVLEALRSLKAQTPYITKHEFYPRSLEQLSHFKQQLFFHLRRKISSVSRHSSCESCGLSSSEDQRSGKVSPTVKKKKKSLMKFSSTFPTDANWVLTQARDQAPPESSLLHIAHISRLGSHSLRGVGICRSVSSSATSVLRAWTMGTATTDMATMQGQSPRAQEAAASLPAACGIIQAHSEMTQGLIPLY